MSSSHLDDPASASPALSESAGGGAGGLMLSRGDRARKFGIDCVDVLSWLPGAWAPGGEYVSKLVLKNVSTTTVKIKYQIPATKFFSMEFPKLTTLSPGMFVAVDVLFRPIRYEPYDDVIRFRTAAGSFGVRVQSFVSTLKVDVPKTVDLGFCPTGEVTKRIIKVRNVGQMAASFRWTHGPPFRLSPLAGTVAPGKSADVEAGLSEAQKQGLVNYYHSTFYDRMSQDYEMVSLPQPNTLRVSIAFTRLGDRNVTLDTVSTYVPQLRLVSEIKTVFTGKPSFVGEAAFEGKLTDAHTGELLGAAVDKRVGGKTIKNFDDWADVKNAIDYWVESFGYNTCMLREGADCKAP